MSDTEDGPVYPDWLGDHARGCDCRRCEPPKHDTYGAVPTDPHAEFGVCSVCGALAVSKNHTRCIDHRTRVEFDDEYPSHDNCKGCGDCTDVHPEDPLWSPS